MSCRWLLSPAVVLVLSGFIFACAASPRTRPLKIAPASDSLTQVRKQLEGTWDLTSLMVAREDAATVSVNAHGVLIYDAYGNLTISGTITDAAYPAASASRLLSFKGRAVIDEPNKQLKLLDVTGDAKDLGPQITPERTRRYELDGEVLRLTSVDASGRATAVATWHKR